MHTICFLPLSRLIILSVSTALASSCTLAADSRLPPEVTTYNLRLGSQGFDGDYQFTTNRINLESAGQLLRMGSDIVKLRLYNHPDRQTTYPSLSEAILHHPEYQTLLQMPFHHYFFWTGSALKDGDWWKRGPHAEREKETYKEMYDLTQKMLTIYNNSSKKFYFGNWEGDWLLMGTGNTPEKRNPTTEAIEGMTAWLNARQRGIDDAKRDTAHTNVDVFFYVEVNRVRDAMRPNSPFTNRLVNTVLPRIRNLDYVSYSSYDAQRLDAADFEKTLNYIESQMCANKGPHISGKRLFIGEYGFGGSLVPKDQREPTRAYMIRALNWGTPFMLFWQVYNNEQGKHFCLIDEKGQDTPVFLLHKDYLARARKAVASFRQQNGRLPDDAEFKKMALEVLESLKPSASAF